MSKCQCGLSIRVVGDGCRYCQPQEYIDRLHSLAAEDEKEKELLERQRDQLLEALKKARDADSQLGRPMSLDDRKAVDLAIAAVEAAK